MPAINKAPERVGLLLIGLVVFSIVSVLAAAAALPPLVARLPADHFARDRPPSRRHPVLALTLRILKNVVGWTLFVAGIAMLFLPGQGLLTILVGIGWMDFPGKRALELRLARRLAGPLNWLRRRRGAPDFEFPDHPS